MRPSRLPEQRRDTQPHDQAYPTPAQRDMLKQWFGVARKTYNATVCIFRGKRRVKKSLAEARIRVERRLCQEKYVAETPLQIRDNAIGDCVVATVAAIKRHQKTGRVASLCFRSRKDESQSIKPYTRSCKALLDGNNRPRLFQMYASLHEAHPHQGGHPGLPRVPGGHEVRPRVLPEGGC